MKTERSVWRGVGVGTKAANTLGGTRYLTRYLKRFRDTAGKYRASEYSDALEALAALLLVRSQLIFFPLRWILASTVRCSGAREPHSSKDPEQSVAIAMRRAVARIPFETNCLCLAIAAARMLNRRGVEARLCFGVRREFGSMRAHAWLETENRVIVDRGNARRRMVWLGDHGISMRTTETIVNHS
jgi:hypothetical protein